PDGALFNPCNRASRQQIIRPGRRWVAWIERVAAQRNEIRKQFLSQQRAAALLAEECTSLFGRASAEWTSAEPAARSTAAGTTEAPTHDEPDYIARCCGLEHHSIFAGTDAFGIPPCHGLLDRTGGEGRAVDIANARGGLAGPAGARSVGIPDGCAHVRIGRAMETKQARLVGYRFGHLDALKQ